jgi:preprotein translocase subunit SecE
MARQTRSQRRARREAQAKSQGSQGFSQRARARQAQVRPAQQQVKSQAGRKEAPRGSFIRESVAELRKVEWPNQRQVIQGTVVVLIACAIVGAFLWVNDLVWQRVVEQIL